jgi:hypothetical protein
MGTYFLFLEFLSPPVDQTNNTSVFLLLFPLDTFDGREVIAVFLCVGYFIDGLVSRRIISLVDW